jgi:hypothetical protein
MVALAVGCLALGCLPAGSPPLGQHVVFDRTLTAVFFTASEADGVPSNLLVPSPARPVGPWGASGFDLYRFPYASLSTTINGLAGVPPTVEGLILEDGAAPTTYIPRTDSRGRLIYLKPSGPESDVLEYVTRFDFATGQEESLAPPGAGKAPFLLSSSRSRVYAGGFIFDSDGTTQVGPLSTAEPAFVDDDLYYGVVLYGDVGVAGSTINRNRPKAPSEVLLTSTAMVEFTPIQSDIAAQLLVSWATDAGAIPYMLLDTKQAASVLLPAQRGQAQFESSSSDGHWLLFREPTSDGDNRLFFFNWTTGDSDALVSNGVPISAENDWRPGQEELWLSFSPRGYSVWNPDAGPPRGDLDSIPIQLTFAPDGRKSMFTRDGSHWLSVKYPTAGKVVEPAIFLGSADDPSLPRIPLNPQGQEFRALWETSDGRLLVGASSFDENRQDIYLVDPQAGSARGIASGGHVVALGRTRALALLNWQVSSSTGDLTLVDLETGAKTVLAQDVYQVAVDPGAFADVPADADRLASGTPVAFLSRNRLASPYDGLWVARLP